MKTINALGVAYARSPNLPYHLSSIFSNDDEEFEATKGISQNTELETLVNQDELEKMLDYVFKLLFRIATK